MPGLRFCYDRHHFGVRFPRPTLYNAETVQRSVITTWRREANTAGHPGSRQCCIVEIRHHKQPTTKVPITSLSNGSRVPSPSRTRLSETRQQHEIHQTLRATANLSVNGRGAEPAGIGVGGRVDRTRGKSMVLWMVRCLERTRGRSCEDRVSSADCHGIMALL